MYLFGCNKLLGMFDVKFSESLFIIHLLLDDAQRSFHFIYDESIDFRCWFLITYYLTFLLHVCTSCAVHSMYAFFFLFVSFSLYFRLYEYFARQTTTDQYQTIRQQTKFICKYFRFHFILYFIVNSIL